MRAIDLFCGFGGMTAGAEMAGARVVYAANHWPLAVEAHSRNHPLTRHVCQDLRQADWSALPNFDLLLGSPACQGHSSASQPKRRPFHDAMRATAWSIVDCADVTQPKAIVVENVLAFKAWRLYPTWRAALETLGYRLTELVVDAARHGVPQRLITGGGSAMQLAPDFARAIAPTIGVFDKSSGNSVRVNREGHVPR